MPTDRIAPRTIDGYISRFPPDVQELLQNVRRTIRNAAPKAQETISYQIPTFTLNGRNLVHFAAFHDHIGFYPTPSGIREFEAELSPYQSGKGTARFPLDRPIPYSLIRKIVKFRVKENMAGAKVKQKKQRKT